jgi:hypothetical protein
MDGDAVKRMAGDMITHFGRLTFSSTMAAAALEGVTHSDMATATPSLPG